MAQLGFGDFGKVGFVLGSWFFIRYIWLIKSPTDAKPRDVSRHFKKTKLKMKTFLLDIFPKLQKFSEKLDNLTLLTNQHWVYIDEILSNKTVYIFRTNNELIISTNGKVEKAKWEYLGNKSILIDKISESYLFKHGFFDENVLALKVDSSEEYAVFVNENRYQGELNSIT